MPRKGRGLGGTGRAGEGRGRLLYTGDTTKNVFKLRSELARAGTVQGTAVLPTTAKLVSLSSGDPNEDLFTERSQRSLAARYAQRGPDVAQLQLAALLEKVPLKPTDEVVIVDLHPHVGDRILGTYQFGKSPLADTRGTFKALIVDQASKKAQPYHHKAAVWTHNRILKVLCEDWLAGTFGLTDLVPQAGGPPQEVRIHPTQACPAPTEAELAAIPGALAAYRGLQGLVLKTLYITGGKCHILPERLRAPLLPTPRAWFGENGVCGAGERPGTVSWGKGVRVCVFWHRRLWNDSMDLPTETPPPLPGPPVSN